MRIVCLVCRGKGCKSCGDSGKIETTPTEVIFDEGFDSSISRETYLRSPIPYPGSKFDSLQHILTHLPPAKKFIDGCGGSGVVTMNLNQSYDLKIFNDRHSGITSFFRVIRDKEMCERLIERLDLTVHSREEFLWCKETWENCKEDLERAARWYYCLFFSFARMGRNFARNTNSRSQSDKALHNKFPLFREIRSKFKEVQVENLDILQCLADYCDRSSVAYIDPDYIGANPSIYPHRVQHKQLLDFIFSSPGYFAVSGYCTDLYDSYPWSDRISWNVKSAFRGKAFTESNNLSDKIDVMSNWENKEEVLWIKDFN